MSRITTAFQKLNGRKALIPYITAGDPNLETTLETMHEMAANGADIIELGIPFSDPMADGPVIQRAAERALANGVSLKNVLETVRRFRERDNDTPVDFDDEFALVRATTQPTTPPALPGDDVPTDSFDEGPATSELDDLYDMLSGVSEDSVRIYVGLDDESAEEAAQERGDHAPDEDDFEETEVIDDFAGIPEVDITETVETSLIGSPQESLIDTEDTSPQPRSRHRRRARVPSWDEIMFGGPAH